MENIVPSTDQNMTTRIYHDSLEKVHTLHVQKSNLTIIATQEQNVTSPSISTGLIGIYIWIVSILLSLIVTLLPQHNSILQPEYWYEGLVIWTIGENLIFAVSVIFERNKIKRDNCILSFGAIIQAFLSLGSGFIIIYTTAHLIWTVGLGNCPPMPHIGVFSYILHGVFLWPITFWLLFPSDMRNDQYCRKKILWYICLMMLRSLLAASYTQITLLFLIPPEYIGPRELLSVYLGILLPVLKFLNGWWVNKLSLKAFGQENDFANFGSIIVVGYLHSFSLSLLLGSSEINGSVYTKYFLISSDFVCNTITFIHILKLHKTFPEEENEMKTKALKCLALKEFLKLLVPAVYSFSFVIAYYGPNADIIGNVKNEYWQFEKVTSLVTKFQNIVIVFLIDAVRGSTFGLILWYFCNLNMFSAYCSIVRHYGVFILFFGSAVINGVK